MELSKLDIGWFFIVVVDENEDFRRNASTSNRLKRLVKTTTTTNRLSWVQKIKRAFGESFLFAFIQPKQANSKNKAKNIRNTFEKLYDRQSRGVCVCECVEYVFGFKIAESTTQVRKKKQKQVKSLLLSSSRLSPSI